MKRENHGVYQPKKNIGTNGSKVETNISQMIEKNRRFVKHCSSDECTDKEEGMRSRRTGIAVVTPPEQRLKYEHYRWLDSHSSYLM